MKRVISFVLLGMALLAGIAWSVQFVLAKLEARQWQTLQGGGQVRFLAATKGPVHQLVLPGPPLSARIRDALRTLSLKPFTNNSKPGPWNRSSGADFGVWFEWRGSRHDDLPKEATLTLSDGRRLVSRQGSGNGGPSGIRYYTCSVFDYVPVRDKTIHFACVFDGSKFECTFTNPYYRNDLPIWKGSPLPQAQRNEDLALTLRELRIEPSPSFQRNYAGTDWTAKPRWSLTKGEQKADTWYSINTTFEDPSGQEVRNCGLFNEPVWKVRGEASRTNEYPFADEEVNWLGTVGPDAPAPETYQLLPVEMAKDNKLELAGIFGPGQYTVGGNSIEKVEPIGNGKPTDRTKIESDFQNKTVHITVPKPVVLFIGSPFLICRDSKGRPARMEHENGYGGVLSVQSYRLPKSPVRIGTVNRGSWKFEFFVSAPPKPLPAESGKER